MMSVSKEVERRGKIKRPNEENYMIFWNNNLGPQGLIARVTSVQGWVASYGQMSSQKYFFCVRVWGPFVQACGSVVFCDSRKLYTRTIPSEPPGLIY